MVADSGGLSVRRYPDRQVFKACTAEKPWWRGPYIPLFKRMLLRHRNSHCRRSTDCADPQPTTLHLVLELLNGFIGHDRSKRVFRC